MKGSRGWHGFYLDLQRRSLKEGLHWKAQLSTVSERCGTMNGSLSRTDIFLSLHLKKKKKRHFFNQTLKKLAATGPSDACLLIITTELHASTKERSIRQIMKYFIQVHILSAGPAHWLPCCMWRNCFTKVPLTTEHTKLNVGQRVIWKTLLELQSRGRRRGGRGFLRSSELWDGTPKFPKIELETRSAAVEHDRSVTFFPDGISNTAAVPQPSFFWET